ncbi:hypothetical protein [Agrococcus beijingensis]|uniref:hypothetical protein n=1 Tax=Agrococcus beijingensis TaxID=3068634 RepID=UPI00274099F6|nr:hypothetical protein [Agrococcus sp. REN33]
MSLTTRVPAGAWILGATAIAGGLGYLLQIFAGIALPAREYEAFGVAWALLYFVVGALAGVQQEVARVAAPRSAAASTPGTRLGLLTAVVAAIGALVVSVCSALGGSDAAVGAAMAAGAAGYAVLAVVTGLLYGARAWPAIAATMVVDALLRAVTAGIALAVGAPLWVVLAGVALPFVATAALGALLLRAQEPIEVAVPTRALARTTLKTLVGSASTAVLVSGFPFVLGLFAHDVDAAELGAFLFAFTLSRAPLVIVFLSLQTFLVTHFKDGDTGRIRSVVLAVLGLATAAAIAAGLAGPWLLETFVGADYVLGGPLLAAIVASAIPMALLCITGPLVLAEGRHDAFATGWVVAAVVSIALLLLPLPFVVRSVIAIAVGPIVGAALQLLLRRRSGG